MKFYSAANVWKQVMFTSDNSTDNTAAPKSYTSPVWGGRELEAGSTVRGGVSVLVDENSFTGTESTKRIVVQTSPKGNTGTILSQIDLQITQQDVRIQRKMLPTEEDIEIVAPKVLENQWNRVDYVLNVADGKGSKNTVDFYLNGVLMNDEPIVVDHNYPADNGTADTVSVGTVSLCVISNGTAPFYIDDITYEYIPADLEVSLEAFDKKVALPDSTDGTVVLGNGSITLMDAATSNVTAADLNGKLCPNTPVSLIDANGATVNSGLAAGNFAYLSRGIHPGIFYKVSDLKVNASGKKVTASMPFAAGSDTVIYVALYKSNGQLAAIAGDTAEDGLLSASVSNDEAASYEVFVWMSNANLKPYYAVANGLLG